MAEFIENYKKGLFEQYELMKEKGLWSENEIKAIQKERENFIQKIKDEDPSIADYMKYIAYERSLLSSIQHREKTTKLDAMTETQLLIVTSLKSLYTESLKYFADDIRFWESFIKFLKFSKFTSEISTVFEDMLKNHGNKPEVWLKAALWEYHENKNMENVKDLFLRGINVHQGNGSLHGNFFDLMLKEANKKNSELILQHNTESEQSLEVANILMIYENTKKGIYENSKTELDNISYCLKLLITFEQYHFTKKLQKVLLSDMINNFPNHPLLWDKLAEKDLNGFKLRDLIEDSVDSADSVDNDASNDSSNGSINGRSIEDLEASYNPEDYLVVLNTEEKWDGFITAMLKINKDLSSRKNLKRSKLIFACKTAHKANFLSARHYFTYIELLRENRQTPNDIHIEIMNSAVEKHPKALQLWKAYMAFFILKGDYEPLKEVFDSACVELDDDTAYPLWKLMLQFYQTRYHLKKEIIPFFEIACKVPSVTFAPFRKLYLEYVIRTQNIKNCRKLYKKLKELPPPSLELHETMAKLEEFQLEPNLEEWRECYENAIISFGISSVELWINYLRFENDQGNPENIANVFARGVKTLEGVGKICQLTQHFNSEYQNNDN